MKIDTRPRALDFSRSTQELLHAAYGPLQMEEPGLHRGLFNGRPFWVERFGKQESFLLLGDIEQRPMALKIWQRTDNVTDLGGLPELSTGDAPFDAVYTVRGRPVEVIPSALDAPTRDLILALALPSLEIQRTAEGTSALTVYRHIPTSMEVQTGLYQPVLPDDLQRRAELAVTLSAKLVGAFDQCWSSISASRGPEAAASWLAAQQGAAQQLASRQRWIRRLVLGGVFGIVGLTLIIILAGTLFCGSCGSCGRSGGTTIHIQHR